MGEDVQVTRAETVNAGVRVVSNDRRRVELIGVRAYIPELGEGTGFKSAISKVRNG